MEQRCPSCGRLLGEVIRVSYSGRAVMVRYELEEDGERVELEHRCGD